MKNILVTGGPVGANLDPVKIVTNKFRGGMMAELANSLAMNSGSRVTYLCANCPVSWPDMTVRVICHDGFHDYMKKACELAVGMDAVIMGAAVANLIPVAYYGKPEMIGAFNSAPTLGERILMPLKEKFPSHNYKPGDSIVMEWTIAPRVIDMVKDKMPKTGHLFGFKLLAGQPHEELIRAAYEVLMGSRATAVFANDPTKGLEKKFVVTKERGVHEVRFEDLSDWIWEMLEDEYYRTETLPAMMDTPHRDIRDSFVQLANIIRKYRSRFVEVEGGQHFGSVAWRVPGGGFVTTGRGKKELSEMAYVKEVDHMIRVVKVNGFVGTTKATLNAPLLDRIFWRKSQKVQGIVHLHEQVSGLPTFPYAPPGTVRDTMTRPCEGPFNIEGHGCFLLLNEKGEEI